MCTPRLRPAAWHGLTLDTQSPGARVTGRRTLAMRKAITLGKHRSTQTRTRRAGRIFTPAIDKEAA